MKQGIKIKIYQTEGTDQLGCITAPLQIFNIYWSYKREKINKQIGKVLAL